MRTFDYLLRSSLLSTWRKPTTRRLSEENAGQNTSGVMKITISEVLIQPPG